MKNMVDNFKIFADNMLASEGRATLTGVTEFKSKNPVAGSDPLPRRPMQGFLHCGGAGFFLRQLPDWFGVTGGGQVVTATERDCTELERGSKGQTLGCSRRSAVKTDQLQGDLDTAAVTADAKGWLHTGLENALGRKDELGLMLGIESLRLASGLHHQGLRG